MTDSGNIADISAFLERAKDLISRGQYDFVPRRKNMHDLAVHGLTITDAKDEILELTVADYYKGPKQDFERSGEIWEFKKHIDDVRFYVKIKIDRINGKDILKCLSFHEDDFS